MIMGKILWIYGLEEAEKKNAEANNEIYKISNDDN